MRRHPLLAAVLLVYVGWGGWNWFWERPLHPPDGVLAADDPRQTDSDLIPEDLALGWGPMSDNRVLRKIDISQSNRFYYWRAPADSPIGKDSIITHSANTHVIPQNSSIARQLSRLRPGQVVTLSGELVDAVRDDGAWIKTSLVRNDTGPGACEVLLVDEVTTLPAS